MPGPLAVVRRAVAADHLVASFVNPLTALSAELKGRHYGGGVLELVPSEIERLAIRPDLNALDHAVRTTAAPDILAGYGGGVITGIGLGKAQQEQLMAGWMTLRNRRRRISPASNPES